MSGEAPADAARCPRCGYDLRGSVAAWQDECPLAGRCTECGLAFGWAEVLRPQKFEPPWCVEFAPWRTCARAFAATMVRSWRPFRFWSALRMSMRIRWPRLAAYAALLLAALLVAGIAVQAAAAIRLRAEMEWSAQQSPKAVIHQSYAAAVAEAVLTPWSRTSNGTIQWPGGVSAYIAPRDIHRALVPPIWGPSLALLVGATWLWLVMPAVFVLLPVSRRRAKVRWPHVWRVFGYSTVIPVLSATAVLWLMTATYAAVLQGGALVTLLVCALAIPAVVTWWAAAIRCYLRIPHAWAIAILMAVMLLLAMPVVIGSLVVFIQRGA